MMALVRRIRDRGVTVMLVEHDMQAVMNLCDVITVMNFGALLVEGVPEVVRNDPAVIRAYLGEEEEGDLPPVVSDTMPAQPEATDDNTGTV